MEKVNYLTDEEITDALRRIGIRQKSELDIAVAEYKKYWWSVYLATPDGNNNKESAPIFFPG
jgi:hypothetical protein